MGLKIVLIVAVLAFFGAADAHRRRHGHRNNNNNNNNNNSNIKRQPQDSFFSWLRDLGNQKLSREIAYFRPGSNLLFGEAVDDILRPLNILPSRSFFDFGGPIPISAFAPLNGPCFISNSTLNQNESQAVITRINGTTIPIGPEIPLDATAVPLSPTEVATLFGAHPALGPFCDNREIIPTYPAGGAPVKYPGPTAVVKLIVLDGLSPITVPLDILDVRRHRLTNSNNDGSSSSSSGSRGNSRGNSRGRYGQRGHRGDRHRG